MRPPRDGGGQPPPRTAPRSGRRRCNEAAPRRGRTASQETARQEVLRLAAMRPPRDGGGQAWCEAHATTRGTAAMRPPRDGGGQLRLAVEDFLTAAELQ